MKKQIKTEQQVLDLLHIEDFRHLSKDKVMEFVSQIPNMPVEVATKCIEQFPEFVKQATQVVTAIRENCTEILDHADKSRRDAVEGYYRLLDVLQDQILYESNTFEQRMVIAEKIKETCDAIAEIDLQHKQFLGKMFVEAGTMLSVVLATSVYFLSGGKINLPKLKG